MLFNFILNFITTFILPFLLMIGLYLYLKPYYLKHEPSLKEYNIGAAIALPLLTIAFFTANYFFGKSFEVDFSNPEEWKLEFWDTLLSSVDSRRKEEEAMYEIFLNLNKIRLIFFLVMLPVGLYLVYGLFHKSNQSARKLKKISIFYSILPTISFFFFVYTSLFTFLMTIHGKSVTHDSAETISVVMLLVSLVITVIAYVNCYKKYSYAVECIFEYGEKEFIPLPFQATSASENNNVATASNLTPPPHPNELAGGYKKDVLSMSDQLIKLKELLDAGILTQDEFDNEKKKLLNS